MAEEPWRGLFNWQLFLFRGVGRVVCRDEVEDAVANGQLEAGAVVLGPERRVDAVESVEGRDEIFCQSHVVGCRVGGDVGPAPEEADEGGREGCGDVVMCTLAPVSAARMRAVAVAASSALAGEPGSPASEAATPSCTTPVASV